MFDKFYKKFLPVYIRLWPLSQCLVIRFNPTHYHSHGIRGHQKETHWQALRIIIGADEYHARGIITIKRGVI